MVLSLIHIAPSVVAAVLTLYISRYPNKGHKTLAYIMAASSVIGLIGFITGDISQLLTPSFHSAHALIGIIVLITSLIAFLTKGRTGAHCTLGRAAGASALVSLAMGSMILIGLVPETQTQQLASIQIPVLSTMPEVEARTFLNTTLMPISQQGNNAIKGTQIIDRDTYRLTVTGLVEENLTLTYTDLLGLQAYAQVAYIPCVEGWGFNAKWTGFWVSDLLDLAGVTGGDYVVFHCSDEYSTGLPLTYLRGRHILLAYGLNDVTLPPDRGFPLQLVAESKYGYKWAKWITSIEIVEGEVRGFWESRGYSNSADVGSFPFG